jgi:hypothetical protein
MLVYKYEYWDEKTNTLRISDTHATFDAIIKGLGVPLLDTAMIAPNTGIFRELIGELPENAANDPVNAKKAS